MRWKIAKFSHEGRRTAKLYLVLTQKLLIRQSSISYWVHSLVPKPELVTRNTKQSCYTHPHTHTHREREKEREKRKEGGEGGREEKKVRSPGQIRARSFWHMTWNYKRSTPKCPDQGKIWSLSQDKLTLPWLSFKHIRHLKRQRKGEPQLTLFIHHGKENQ